MNLINRLAKLEDLDTEIMMIIESAQSINDRSQIVGKGSNTESHTTVSEIEYNLAYTNELSDSSNLSDKIQHRLLDVDGSDDRFFPITEVISILTKNSMILYYDKKYKDFIFIPLLEKLNQSKITISIYSVRGLFNNSINSDIGSTLHLPLLKNNSGAEENTNTYICDSKTHVFYDSTDEISRFKAGGAMLSDKYYAETTRVNAEEYFSLGSSDTLFESEPNVLMYQDLILTNPIISNAKKHIDDVLIRIPF